MAIGSKLGIDATIPPCGTPANSESACSRFIGVRNWPPLIKMDPMVKQKINEGFANR